MLLIIFIFFYHIANIFKNVLQIHGFAAEICDLDIRY